MIDIVWAGSGIDEAVYLWFVNNVPLGSTVVEFGVGDVSTPALSEVYDLYSVEDNAEWAWKHKKTKYIHAPIVGKWYDVEIMKAGLPSAARAILVDGPMGKRSGMLENLEIVTSMRPEWVVFHDTYREEESAIAQTYSNAMRAGLQYYSEPATGAYWAVIHDPSSR